MIELDRPSAGEHPITPPPELVAQCYEEAKRNLQDSFSPKSGKSHAIRTAYAAGYAAGADQELEACCEWLDDTDCEDPQEASLRLRWHRRPKPPTLKEQALEALEAEDDAMPLRSLARSERFDAIRRALKTSSPKPTMRYD